MACRRLTQCAWTRPATDRQVQRGGMRPAAIERSIRGVCRQLRRLFSDGIRNSRLKAAALAELRTRLGDDTVDHLQHSWERMRHPRPLTDSEREVIEKATAPVLRDLEVSGAIVPVILYQSTDGDSGDGLREGVCTNIALGAGHGGNVWIPTEECSSAEQVWWAANSLQEWEIHELWEFGRSTTWPECPEHPNTHPLEPDIDGKDAAVWQCPRTQRAICAIGALGSHQ